MSVISISNQKGGVGKTTGTRNLAERTSQLFKKKVLVIDNDPSGNLTNYFLGKELPAEIEEYLEEGSKSRIAPGISHSILFFEEDKIPEPLKIKENLYLIGSSQLLAAVETCGIQGIFEYKEKMNYLSEMFDYIFVDCPPSAGYFQTAAHSASDYLLIPTTLDEDSVVAIEKQLKSANQNKKGINRDLKVLGIYFNEKETRSIRLQDLYFDETKVKYSELIFKNSISKSVKVSESRTFCKSVISHAPKSLQAEQYDELTKEVIERCEA